MFFPKWTTVNGLKCQGKTEARIANLLFEIGCQPTRGAAQSTPFGRYSPDFDCGSFFIEVKALNSWLQAHGIIPLMEGARDTKLASKSDTQHLKMLHVNSHVKPVIVVVDMTFSKKSYQENTCPESPLCVIMGSLETIKGHLQDLLNSTEDHHAT